MTANAVEAKADVLTAAAIDRFGSFMAGYVLPVLERIATALEADH